jgi:hydrogenase small subunit
MSETVQTLAEQDECLAVIGIGQCATFGGYPACKSPLDSGSAGFDTSLAQSGAKGVYDFLYDDPATRAYAAKVVNVPGCPTNPWWFVLTVVGIMVDIENGFANGGADGPLGIVKGDLSLNPAALDSTRRLKIAYPTAIHGPYCPRFNDWSIGLFAEKPGDPGCLQKIGCKGPAVKSLCGMHGWNAQQPNNDTAWEYNLASSNPAAGGNRGGHCTRAGHPCMGCTEKGYPDTFVPFVTW